MADCAARPSSASRTGRNNLDGVSVDGIESDHAESTGMANRFVSYRRFGATLEVDVTVLDAPSDASLHTIVLHVSNVGTAPIWDPRVQVKITEIHGAGTTTPRMLEANYQLAGIRKSDRKLINVLDSDETTDFVAQTMVDQAVWAVTYLVTLRSSAGDAWSTVHSIEGHRALQPQVLRQSRHAWQKLF